MEIQNKFYNLTTEPSINNVIKASGNSIAQNFNCMRIGIVQEFYPEDFTVSVLIANKRDILQRIDGTRETRNYALVRAKVCFCNPFITNPIKKGDECVLLFADREIESWFINGEVNPTAYPRMHDLTDCVAILGVRSLPNMITMLADCLNLFYGNSNIALSENVLNINSPTVQISNLQAMNGDTGTFVSQDNKVVTVENGIITSIVGSS